MQIAIEKFGWRGHPNVFMDINEDTLKKHRCYHSKLIPPYNKDFWNEPALQRFSNTAVCRQQGSSSACSCSFIVIDLINRSKAIRLNQTCNDTTEYRYASLSSSIWESFAFNSFAKAAISFLLCIDAITFRGNIYFESEFNEWFRPDLSSLSITTSQFSLLSFILAIKLCSSVEISS